MFHVKRNEGTKVHKLLLEKSSSILFQFLLLQYFSVEIEKKCFTNDPPLLFFISWEVSGKNCTVPKNVITGNITTGYYLLRLFNLIITGNQKSCHLSKNALYPNYVRYIRLILSYVRYIKNTISLFPQCSKPWHLCQDPWQVP